LSSPTDNLVISASRDTTAILWQRESLNVPFSPSTVLRAGSRYVNSVAYIPPSPDAPKGEALYIQFQSLILILHLKGYAVTGGQEAVINIFSLASLKDDPDFSLLGHTENVCALDVTAGGAIVSGSWDK
jgi:phospholipase A-2-activating protein